MVEGGGGGEGGGRGDDVASAPGLGSLPARHAPPRRRVCSQQVCAQGEGVNRYVKIKREILVHVEVFNMAPRALTQAHSHDINPSVPRIIKKL